jgi:hypothetical protein
VGFTANASPLAEIGANAAARVVCVCVCVCVFACGGRTSHQWDLPWYPLLRYCGYPLPSNGITVPYCTPRGGIRWSPCSLRQLPLLGASRRSTAPPSRGRRRRRRRARHARTDGARRRTRAVQRLRVCGGYRCLLTSGWVPIVPSQSTHSTQSHREYEHIAARLAARGEASRCKSRPHGSQQCVHDGALRLSR